MKLTIFPTYPVSDQWMNGHFLYVSIYRTSERLLVNEVIFILAYEIPQAAASLQYNIGRRIIIE